MRNFAGRDTSVIEIKGFKDVKYESNTHQENENWISNSYRLTSALYRQQTSSETPLLISDPSEIQTRARSIVHFRGLEWLTATSNSYTKNYVVDIHSPYASARTIQSNGILVEDLVGRLDLSSSSFDSNSGMNGFSTSGVYSSINGFASQLIGFNRVTLTELLFNDMSFSSNFGEREEEDIPSTYE